MPYVLAVDTGLTASSGDVVQVVMHGNSLAATVNGDHGGDGHG